MDKKALTFSSLAFIFFLLLYSYKITTSLPIDTDLGRDLNDIIDIAQGNLTLTGPRLSIGLYAGAYYYYSLLPGLMLGKLSLSGLLLWHASIFAFAAAFNLYMLLRSNLPPTRSIIFSLILALSPFYIASARHPGNAFSYLALLLLFLTIYFFAPPRTKEHNFLYGFLSGIIANFHPVSLILITPLLLIKRKVLKLSPLALGLVLSYLPLFIFELRHKFVITQHLFIPHMRSTPSIQPHYLLPFKLFLLFFLAYLLIKRSGNRVFPLPLLLFLVLLYFPLSSYKLSPQNINRFAQATEFVIDKQLLRPREPFNIIGIIGKDIKVPYGDKYRYLFKARGLRPLPKQDYSSARKIIIFSQDPAFSPARYNSLEMDQFGPNHLLTRRFNSADIQIYLLSK